MKKKKKGLLLITMLFIGIGGILLINKPREDVEAATKALKQNGYIPIKVGGTSWLYGAGFHTQFKAIDKNKDTITGVVDSRIDLALGGKNSVIRVNN